jgi:hypothetical protein
MYTTRELTPSRPDRISLMLWKAYRLGNNMSEKHNSWCFQAKEPSIPKIQEITKTKKIRTEKIKFECV